MLTATAATIGEPTASTPRQISNTPHTSDNVDACRTTPERFCTIKASSSDGGSLLQRLRGFTLKKKSSGVAIGGKSTDGCACRSLFFPLIPKSQSYLSN